jgi:hypothetical protein
MVVWRKTILKSTGGSIRRYRCWMARFNANFLGCRLLDRQIGNVAVRWSRPTNAWLALRSR